jgi:hypothetical protein
VRARAAAMGVVVRRKYKTGYRDKHQKDGERQGGEERESAGDVAAKTEKGVVLKRLHKTNSPDKKRRGGERQGGVEIESAGPVAAKKRKITADMFESSTDEEDP